MSESAKQFTTASFQILIVLSRPLARIWPSGLRVMDLSRLNVQKCVTAPPCGFQILMCCRYTSKDLTIGLRVIDITASEWPESGTVSHCQVPDFSVSLLPLARI